MSANDITQITAH